MTKKEFFLSGVNEIDKEILLTKRFEYTDTEVGQFMHLEFDWGTIYFEEKDKFYCMMKKEILFLKDLKEMQEILGEIV